MSERPCETCGGARLKKEALCVRIADHNIYDVAAKSIESAHAFLSAPCPPPSAAAMSATAVSAVPEDHAAVERL